MRRCFIRSALVLLFALLPLLEPGASLTGTEGTSKTVSSVSERSQPSCLAASHSSRQVGFPFIIHLIFPCIFGPCFYFSLVQSLRCLWPPLLRHTSEIYFHLFMFFPSRSHPPRTPQKEKENYLVPKSTTSVALVVHRRPRDLQRL